MADDAANYEQNQMKEMERPTHEDLHVENAEREENRVYYPTNNSRGIIYDAITGYPHRWKVGSNNSLRLYQVTDATGLVDENGIMIQFNQESNRMPNTLYYESPEAYERHRQIVDTDTDDRIKHRDAWYDLKARLFGSSSPDQDESNNINMSEYRSWRDGKKAKLTEQLENAQQRSVQEQTEKSEAKMKKEENEKERRNNFEYAFAENKGRNRADRRVVKAYLAELKRQKNIQMRKEGSEKAKAKAKANEDIVAEALKIKHARRARNKAKYLKNKQTK